MVLASLDPRNLMVGLAVLFLGVWIAVVVWFARSKATPLVKTAVFAVMALGSFAAAFVAASLALLIPFERHPLPGWVWIDEGLLVNPAGEQTFDFSVEEPCSLQVQAREQRGRSFGVRVSQDGQTIYNSDAQAGQMSGTVHVGEGKATVAVRNDDAQESKTVNITVAQQRPRD